MDVRIFLALSDKFRSVFKTNRGGIQRGKEGKKTRGKATNEEEDKAEASEEVEKNQNRPSSTTTTSTYSCASTFVVSWS